MTRLSMNPITRSDEPAEYDLPELHGVWVVVLVAAVALGIAGWMAFLLVTGQ